MNIDVLSLYKTHNKTHLWKNLVALASVPRRLSCDDEHRVKQERVYFLERVKWKTLHFKKKKSSEMFFHKIWYSKKVVSGEY